MFKLAVFTIVLSLMFKANKTCLFPLVDLPIFFKAKEETGGAWSVESYSDRVHMDGGEGATPGATSTPLLKFVLMAGGNNRL